MIILFLAMGFSMESRALGTLTALKGEVSLKVKGKKAAAQINQEIPKGAIVMTGEKSYALIEFKTGDKVKVGSRSLMRIKPPRGKDGLELVLGSVFALVKKDSKKGGQFKVKTKSAVAGVRGTQFFTSYGSEKSADDIWLCVNEGEVEVSSLRNSHGRKSPVLVKAGEGISVKKEGISDPKPLAWTRNLNWDMDPKSKSLENTVNIEDAYKDVLDEDYD